MHCAKFPKRIVIDFFKIGLSTPEVVSFKSGHMLHKVLDTMIETAPWKRGEVDFPLQKGVEWYSRDIIACAQYLCKQPAFNSYMIWAPTRSRDYEGSRIYSELHTGDWWWVMQVSDKISIVGRPILIN